jgi:hypothetical protein
VFTNVLEEQPILIFSKEVQAGMWIVYAGKCGEQKEESEKTCQA